MSIEVIIDQLPAELRIRLERDAERAKQMTSGAHLQDWLDYEVGLRGIRKEAMRVAFTDRPKGRPYNEASAQLMQHYGLDRLDRGSTTAVLWLTDPQDKYQDGERHLTRMEILDEILKALDPGQRSRLCSPISAQQRVKKRIDELAAKAVAGTAMDVQDAEKKPTKFKQTEQSLAVALEKIERLNEQVERSKSDGSWIPFDLLKDKPYDIGEAIAANCSEDRASKIAHFIEAAIKRKKEDAAEARAEAKAESKVPSAKRRKKSKVEPKPAEAGA